MKHIRAAAIALAGTLFGTWATTASADDSATNERERKVWVTNFDGKPPFKRELVSAAEFARFEETKRAELPAVGERLHVVDTSGRPPFKRQIVEIDAENAAEFARFEEEEPVKRERRRFGAPGKGFGRR